jgi:phosphopantetheine--protein transferase-like protein
MDGNQTDKVIAYVSRLTGRPVSADERVVLRSVQRASLATWLKGERIPIRGSLVGTSASGFVINELLFGRSSDGAVKSPAIPNASIPTGSAIGFAGIGIDIEDSNNLPDTDDYREHPFYQDTFTPREIAYCLRQPNAKASFCGTWAAKEAILKSGMPGTSIDHLKSIEILHDKDGRPQHAGYALSISHTDRTAIAVCVVTAQRLTHEVRQDQPPDDQTPTTRQTSKSNLAKMRVSYVLLSIVLSGAMFLLGRLT